jgi:hypothetical protein
MRRVIAALLAVAALVLDPVMPPRSESAGGCTHVVTNTGSYGSKFRVCVSAAGNIVEFEAPAGEDLIHPVFYEGYHLCSASIMAYDHSSNAVAGFGAPVLVDSSPLTINRTTSNGVFTVTQIFQPDKTEKDLKVTMKVKNNSAVTQTDVGIGRGWDAGTGLEEIGFVNLRYSVTMFYPEGVSGGGLTLTALSTGGVSTFLWTYDWWRDQVRGTATMCSANPSYALVDAQKDLFGFVSYFLGHIAPGATKTVIFSYRKV